MSRVNSVYTEVQCGLEFNKFDEERENFYADSYGKGTDAKTLSLYGPWPILHLQGSPFSLTLGLGFESYTVRILQLV